MKFKLLAGITLVIAVAGGIWWSQHSPKNPRDQTSQPVELAADVPPKAVSSGPGQASARPAIQALHPAAGKPATPLGIPAIIDAQADYSARVSAINSLPGTLGSTDWATLKNFLLQRGVTDREQSGQVLKNKLLNALCSLNPPPSDLGETLVQIYRDRGQDEVIRDYAVQHMVELYEQLEETHAEDPKTRQLVQEVLWEVAGQAESGTAGTALLGLERLSRGRTEFDRERLGKTALELAGNERTSDAALMTVFQVCSRMELKGAAPVVRDMARNSKTTTVRISAIAALAALGDATDKPWLQEIANGSEARLRLPAQQALNRMQQLELQKPLGSKEKI